MTYVTRDGQVMESQPWSVGKVVALFWGFIDLIIAFFQTLISPWTQSDDKRGSSNFRAGGASRWGGGGGGGGGGPRGPPKPPSRRNIHGLNDIRGPPGPPPACGSCCG